MTGGPNKKCFIIKYFQMVWTFLNSIVIQKTLTFLFLTKNLYFPNWVLDIYWNTSVMWSLIWNRLMTTLEHFMQLLGSLTKSGSCYIFINEKKKKHLIANKTRAISAEKKLGIKKSVGMKIIQHTELKMPNWHRIGIFSSNTSQSPKLISKADFLKSTI